MTEELFSQDPYLQICEARVTHIDTLGIRLDRTIFYPEGGGQPGDIGSLRTDDGQEIPITDTIRQGNEIVHIPDNDLFNLSIGDKVVGVIDWNRRYLHMRMHTALHLLCALVEGNVTGGQITQIKSRLDFNIPDNKPDKKILTEKLNLLVQGDHKVTSRFISDEELEENPSLVRTLSVNPPKGSERLRLLEIVGVDIQPCGGTHVLSTGEIGKIEVTKIESKGNKNRRIVIRLADAE